VNAAATLLRTESIWLVAIAHVVVLCAGFSALLVAGVLLLWRGVDEGDDLDPSPQIR
jgi:hypothetical protein